jgi:hypothetical protein
VDGASSFIAISVKRPRHGDRKARAIHCSEPSAHSRGDWHACLFTLVVRFKTGIFAVGFQGSFYFAVCIWGALALQILPESAIFVRLHRLVVIGRLLG